MRRSSINYNPRADCCKDKNNHEQCFPERRHLSRLYSKQRNPSQKLLAKYPVHRELTGIKKAQFIPLTGTKLHSAVPPYLAGKKHARPLICIPNCSRRCNSLCRCPDFHQPSGLFALRAAQLLYAFGFYNSFLLYQIAFIKLMFTI